MLQTIDIPYPKIEQWVASNDPRMHIKALRDSQYYAQQVWQKQPIDVHSLTELCTIIDRIHTKINIWQNVYMVAGLQKKDIQLHYILYTLYHQKMQPTSFTYNTALHASLEGDIDRDLDLILTFYNSDTYQNECIKHKVRTFTTAIWYAFSRIPLRSHEFDKQQVMTLLDNYGRIHYPFMYQNDERIVTPTIPRHAYTEAFMEYTIIYNLVDAICDRQWVYVKKIWQQQKAQLDAAHVYTDMLVFIDSYLEKAYA